MNLDVFILSYNRADYLRETLESLHAQTCQDFRIVVLDNASTDHTPEVVRDFSKLRQVHLHQHPKNIGGVDNFYSVSKLAEANWVMAFHDDDIIHPRYIEVAMDALRSHPDCRLIASNYAGVKMPSLPELSKQELIKDFWLFKDAAHFASFCYTLNKIHFGSVIYRRDRLLTLNKEKLRPFGKILDRPAMLETIISGGGAIVFKAPFIQYREHPNQDSQSSSSGPFLSEAIALTSYYAGVMGKSWKTSAGRCFIVNNRAYLKGMYKWCSDRNNLRFNQFIGIANKSDAATAFSYLPRPLMRLIKKILQRTDSNFF
jgi:glycosyltransferase involved in cell wall biosynthesis